MYKIKNQTKTQNVFLKKLLSAEKLQLRLFLLQGSHLRPTLSLPLWLSPWARGTPSQAAFLSQEPSSSPRLTRLQETRCKVGNSPTFLTASSGPPDRGRWPRDLSKHHLPPSNPSHLYQLRQQHSQQASCRSKRWPSSSSNSPQQKLCRAWGRAHHTTLGSSR